MNYFDEYPQKNRVKIKILIKVNQIPLFFMGVKSF